MPSVISKQFSKATLVNIHHIPGATRANVPVVHMSNLSREGHNTVPTISYGSTSFFCGECGGGRKLEDERVIEKWDVAIKIRYYSVCITHNRACNTSRNAIAYFLHILLAGNM